MSKTNKLPAFILFVHVYRCSHPWLGYIIYCQTSFFNYADGLAKILLGVTYCTTNHYCCNHSTIIIAKRRPAGLDNAGLISVWVRLTSRTVFLLS